VTEKARIEHTEEGAHAASPGWFVLNIADARWAQHDIAGRWTDLEPPDGFEHYGIGIHVLEPGQPNGKYHSENVQEDFLVLSGECILIVEDEERHLKAWDFFHCAPGTNHIIVGAGDGPCAILMAGAHLGPEVRYPVSEVAARYGASVEKETSDPEQVYETAERFRRKWPPYSSRLPWA